MLVKNFFTTDIIAYLVALLIFVDFYMGAVIDQWQLINRLVGVFESKVAAGYKIVKTIIVVNCFGVVIFFREQRRKRLVRGMIDFWYSALNSFKVSSL